MILGNINSTINYDSYPKIIQEIIRNLKKKNFDDKDPGVYEIQGKDIFAKIIVGETVPKEQKYPEVHREYIDLQYVINGTLNISYGVDNIKNKIAVEYDENKDILFYENCYNEIEISLVPGSFIVFPVGIVHRTDYSEKKTEFKKIIIKINKRLLSL